MSSLVSIIGPLEVIGAVLWALAYVLLILRAGRDTRVGMPPLALALNVATESVFGLLFATRTPPYVSPVYVVWLLLDAAIVVQACRFGFSGGPDGRSPRARAARIGVAIALAVVVVIGITVALGDWESRAAAFGGNLLMSLLFLDRLRRTGDARGQSMAIAWTKGAGTLCFTAGFVITWPDAPIVAATGVVTAGIDAAYLLALRRHARRLYAPAAAVSA